MEQTLYVFIAVFLVLALSVGFSLLISRQNSTIRRLKADQLPEKSMAALRDSVEALAIKVQNAIAESNGNAMQIGEALQRIRKIQNKLNKDQHDTRKELALENIQEYITREPEVAEQPAGPDSLVQTVDGDVIDYR